MDIIAMAGPTEDAKKIYLNRLMTALRKAQSGTFNYHILQNAIQRATNQAPSQIDGKALAVYASYLTKQAGKYSQNGTIGKLIARELFLIQNGVFRGSIATPINGIGRKGRGRKKLKKFFKKVGKGAKSVLKPFKKVALAPSRNAFLALVRINFRGLAYKLEKAIKKDAGKISKVWERFGGNFNRLKSATEKGAKKRPLLGSKVKRGMNGLYDTPVIISGIGVEPATTTAAAATATATPVLAKIIPIILEIIGKSIKGKKDEDTGEELPTDTEGKTIDALTDLGSEAIKLAAGSGLPTNINSEGESFEVADVEEGASATAGQITNDPQLEGAANRINIDTSATGTGSLAINPLVIGAVALGALLILKKR